MQKVMASAGLVIATMVWGCAFVAQRSAMTVISPWAFSATRCLVGALALIPVIMIHDWFISKKFSFWGGASMPEERRRLLSGGFFCGLAITPAMLAQQAGLCDTAAGKSGFLTALYIIIVPVLGIFLRHKTSRILWLAVVMALGGSFLLCYTPGQVSINRGDMMVILCAFLYSIHILVCDHFAPRTDCLRLSLLQFVTATLLAGLMSLFFAGSWSVAGIVASAPYWLYAGIGSCALAFTLQMVAQKYLHPVMTSLLMSLESVFAVLAGWLLLQEHLNHYELTGCIVLFSAIIVAQLPERRGKSGDGKAASAA